MSWQPPALNGLAASSVQLKAGEWKTVLEALCVHFPAIPQAEWQSRLARGRVFNASGEALGEAAAAKLGSTLHYYREVAAELPIPFEEAALFEDEHLLVADKPHFLPVTPAGSYVEQTLLARLVRRTGNTQLVPLHRIDRTTAGLVLFSTNAASRGRYQALFREQAMHKCYHALAAPLPGLQFPLLRQSRIVEGTPFFRMQEAQGAPNSETRIEVLERHDAHWLYALHPVSGKKHQLRVHMAALGAPIVNDDFYPTLAEQSEGDYSSPLKLLAHSLAFSDPLTGEARHFKSGLKL